MLLKSLKIVTASGCLVGFIFNSLAIMNTFLEGATTVASQQEVLKDGFKAPLITVCRSVPFKILPWNNMSYDSYDENALATNNIIDDFGIFVNGRVNRNASAEFYMLYTIDKGKCYSIQFMERVIFKLLFWQL